MVFGTQNYTFIFRSVLCAKDHGSREFINNEKSLNFRFGLSGTGRGNIS